MRVKNPPIRARCTSRVHRTAGLTVTEAAKRLGVTRQALNNLVNGKGGISAEMACDFPKRSDQARKCGSACRWPTIYGRHASAQRQQRSGEQRQQPQDGGAVHDGRPGPTNCFWRAADWLLCRDGKWRPVEPGTFPLAHGATSRVGRLRAYGNAINAAAAVAFVSAYMECRP